VRLRRALPHQLVEVTAAAGRAGKVRVEGNDRWTILVMIGGTVWVECGETVVLHGLCRMGRSAHLLAIHDGPPLSLSGSVLYHCRTNAGVSSLQHLQAG
jgi:hypothetical protein